MLSLPMVSWNPRGISTPFAGTVLRMEVVFGIVACAVIVKDGENGTARDAIHANTVRRFLATSVLPRNSKIGRDVLATSPASQLPVNVRRLHRDNKTAVSQ